ncbi:hypothetical protein [Neolewinella agarilytica]|uniref:Uncharacterized protein n=1 Tax=Neolewinella agarilytica TaxID=478744 RepID=A0A1H9E3S0_9BACT|nr:hypothetical protein [Neolewinella agarilytica]SEQ20232.1 hypothetical protein SAMN05444359_106237 [Neolewinella agarilytica]
MNEFSDYHSSLPNEDLVSIAYFDKRKTKKEARLSAKSVLQKRAVSTYQIEVLKKTIRERKQEERKRKLKDKNEKYGLLDFILDVFLLS